MPTYTYRCPACDHGFEVAKPMAEVARAESCPKCRQPITADDRDYQAEGGGLSGYVSPFEGMYPYVSKRLAGTAAAKDLKHVSITRAGVTMQAPIIESKAQERSLMARHGLERE
jgi:putative FmdB family regulatory protein